MVVIYWCQTVVKRQNIASLDHSNDVLARHKRPENGFMHRIMTDDITWIYSSEQKSKLVSKQWVQDGSQSQKNSNNHILMENSCHFSGIRNLLYWHVNILKYRTVMTIYNSNVILPKLIANLWKLGSEIRMKNVFLHQDYCLSTYSQQNKRLIDDTIVLNCYTFYLQSYSCPECL